MENKKGKLNIREAEEKGRTRVYVSDGVTEARFTKLKKGVYNFGSQKAANFIKANRDTLVSNLSDSAMNLMTAVSENEGNLDAVNTWDNSFMTFGMFQWTIGGRGDPGELPALLRKIKERDEKIFEKCYGQYGLDIFKTGRITGFFKLKTEAGETILNTRENKELLRTNEWAFYFWKSGQDPTVQSVEIEHALSRINTFYSSRGYKIKYKGNQYHIKDLLTSEYGVGLVLDNHVNRPGYVRGCLEKALEKANLPEDPESWNTEQENALINAYLKIRETYGKHPMTHAGKRAEVVKRHLEKKTISNERGSFKL